MNDLYYVHCIRPIFMDIWRVERYACFWLSWFSKLICSSTVITFSSVRACFSVPVSCLWSVLPVFQIFCNVSSATFLLFIFENFARRRLTKGAITVTA